VQQYTSSETLLAEIIVTLNLGVPELREAAERYITSWVGKAGADMLRKLYYFMVMHNGYTVFNAMEADAINSGFAFLVDAKTRMILTPTFTMSHSPAATSLHARMFGEPVVREVFAEKVDVLYPNGLKCEPSADPIYREIFAYHQHNLGGSFEETVMRSYMRMNSPNLLEAFNASSCGVRNDSVAAYAKFAGITKCGSALELGVSEYGFLLNPMYVTVATLHINCI
jgi:hypothetical protein